ncbi:MAG: hypothetical protein ACI4C1_07220 [Lachnospiraceae bacterium]
MTGTEKLDIMNRINEYADTVLKNVNLTDKKVSWQLEQLRPIMTKLAEEYHTDLATIFITYMDSNVNRVAEEEKKYQNKMAEMDF